ncbi:integrase family protein [Acidovorax phage ACPWH]|nr:integrase family protein [Acidovorax phage ACPWH]
MKAAGDGIEVRFKLQGKTMRPRLSMPATKSNLLHAALHREKVLEAVGRGTFRMADFFPDYRLRERLREVEPASGRTLQDWVGVWEPLAARELEHSTLRIYLRHLRAYWLPKFGARRPEDIGHEAVVRHLALLAKSTPERPGLSRKTQNNILIPLRAVFALIQRSTKVADPTAGIVNLRVQTAEPDPFTAEELCAALAAVERKHGAEVRDYFAFAAYAGLRTSEQIALQWADVSLRAGTVRVHRSRVLASDKARTKTARERLVELNVEAQGVLLRARTGPAGHVFRNPATGRPWNDEQEQRRLWASALEGSGVRYRPPKELRDTSVTLALASGADPWYVAQQHGHSLQVMLKSYARWIPSADRGRNRDKINQALGVAGQKEGV